MELHQLRYLVTVVDEGSFTAAAERLHVSQSGISAQVAKLERELGQRLLDRGPRSLRLTTAGEAVLPLARSALGEVERIRTAGDELAGLLRGRLTLGMVRGCSIPFFLDAVADFRRDHAGVELSLAEDDATMLQRRVASGDLDVALVAWAGDLLADLEGIVAADEPVAVIVPARHRLASMAARPRWRDLDGETVLGLTRGTGIRAAVDASLARAGEAPVIDLEASSPETVLGLVARGAGVALLTDSIVAGRADLVARPMADAPVTARLGVVRRAGVPSPAVRVLYDALVAALADPAAQPSEDVPVSGAQHRPKS